MAPPRRVAIHARIVQPFLDMTCYCLVAADRDAGSRNVFVAMGVCMVVTTAFTLVVAGSQTRGDLLFGLHSSLAAWLPLMIFVPLAAWLVETLWK